ncbi:hypothetical protein INR49_023866 [Caranx melampygus]|nr:hypothetical protein INR49_023866 [Caranx melampygus]
MDWVPHSSRSRRIQQDLQSEQWIQLYFGGTMYDHDHFTLPDTDLKDNEDFLLCKEARNCTKAGKGVVEWFPLRDTER